ncbi:MAG: hypothetical protein GQ574_03985 [Crocinitomix sp.]|nr:hypothetical protein [Crocinitomix sp.]
MKAYMAGGLDAESTILNQLKSELKIDHFDPNNGARCFDSLPTAIEFLNNTRTV